jgi:hypothetical protein
MQPEHFKQAKEAIVLTNRKISSYYAAPKDQA